MNFELPQDTPKGQRDAVNADEKVITVSAGAGTGKTWVLSGRYTRLLADEKKETSPKNILTLTYTEAAAADMKQRILERIKTDLKGYDESRLSESWISTIHSFAGRLIRESGLSLDIDPLATVITAQQEQEFWDTIRNAVEFANLRELARTYGNKDLRDAAKSLDENPLMTNAVNKWHSDKLSDFARATAELQASSGRSWEEMLKWAEKDFEKLIEPTSKKIQKILEPEWLEVWKIFQDINLPPSNSKSPYGTKLQDLLNRQKERQTVTNKELKKFYNSIVIDKDKEITGRGYHSTQAFKDLAEIMGMTFAEWRKTRSETLREISASFGNDISQEEMLMRATLLKFCAVSWGMWDMMKRRRSLLSFSDMILHAGKVIEKNAVKEDFKHIMVDEFQDTDGQQFNMIASLKKQLNASLFAVGDPKQSIYKFRHANPELFAGLMKESEREIELNESFRTRKTLLEKINKIFEALWHDGIGKSEAMKGVKFHGLKAHENNTANDEYKDRDTGTMPDFKIILAKNQNGLAETRKNLAEELAFNISKWVSEGRTIWDKKQKCIRPVKFSDFTVLSRSRNVFGNIEAAFEKFNIPSIRDRSEDFFTRGEIGDVVCMLRAAADFDDSFSVMGWLMSPFSGVSEDDVIDKIFANTGKKANPITLIKINLPEAYSRLEYLSLIGANEGPAGILEFFNKDRRWLSCYREQDRLRVLRNFRLALSMSRAFQQSGTSSLTACAQWLTRAVRRELKIEEPKWHDEDENAVNLTAVHSSKGLEYPVTVVFDTQKNRHSEKSSLRPSKNLGLVFSNLPDECMTGREKTEPVLFKWDNVIETRDDIEEDQRLFYVAVTRAQDSLIFCGMTDGKDGEPAADVRPYKDSWTDFLINNINEGTKKIITYAEGNIEVPEAVKENECDDNPLIPRQIIHAENSLRQISASSFSLFKWCPFAWRRRYRQGLTLSWDLNDREFDDDNDGNENFTGGADLGSLAHWILARWPVNENFESELEYYLNDREMILRLPPQLRETWRDRKNKTALSEWLMKFASGKTGLELINNKDVKREYRFSVRLDDKNKTLMAGAIDAFYGNNLIDYKLTSINDAPAGLYESQLDFYALALHELTGLDEINTTTVFLRDGICRERVCKNFDEIKAEISKASVTCACGNLEPEYKHCSSCPFRKGCSFMIE